MAAASFALPAAAQFGTPPTIWYVKPTGTGSGASWANAANMQTALDSAATGDMLWLTEGSHYPTFETIPGNARSRTFRVTTGVRIYGGFLGTEPANTIPAPLGQGPNSVLYGELGSVLTPTDNCYHVVTVQTTQRVEVHGLSIWSGYVEATAPSSLNGAGMLCGSAVDLFLHDVNFGGSTAAAYGGSLYVPSGTVDLNACYFLNDTAGYGAGISTGAGTTLRAFSCYFAVSSAVRSGGAFHLTGGTAWLVNTFVRYGSAPYGGAMTFGPGQTTHVINGTFGQNTSVGGAGTASVLLSDAAATTSLRNCIVWDNSTPTAALKGNFTAEYCDVEGGVTGVGNLNVNPMWNSLSFAPAPGSPVNDAGNNGALVADMLDLDGDGNTTEPTPFDRISSTRVVDDAAASNTGCCGTTIVDMGAYERP